MPSLNVPKPSINLLFLTGTWNLLYGKKLTRKSKLMNKKLMYYHEFLPSYPIQLGSLLSQNRPRLDDHQHQRQRCFMELLAELTSITFLQSFLHPLPCSILQPFPGTTLRDRREVETSKGPQKRTHQAFALPLPLPWCPDAFPGIELPSGAILQLVLEIALKVVL